MMETEQYDEWYGCYEPNKMQMQLFESLTRSSVYPARPTSVSPIKTQTK